MDNTTKATTVKTGLQTIAATDFADAKLHRVLLRQVVIGLQANQHRSTANAKTRGEVSGGGKKPWRQKGTGRARVGSSRTPVWRGGGIVFGPTSERNYSHILTPAMKKHALLTALALKAKAGKLHTITLTGTIDKTKSAIKAMPEVLELSRVLLVLPDTTYALAFRNLHNIQPALATRINVLDLINFTHVVFVNDAYDQIKAKLSK